MPWAVKFGYLGWMFHGYQVQPGVRTVEGEIMATLQKYDAGVWRGGSRTDAGVSALGNVGRLDTDDVERALGILNSSVDGAFFWSYAGVNEEFNPRHAVWRWYRYFLPYTGQDVMAMREAASLLVGQHDFRAFCREDGRDTRREILSLDITRRGVFLLIDVKGRSFLWQMVRRMVSALDEVGKGKKSVEDIERYLQGDEKYTSVAPAEGLVLMDVHYGFEFRRFLPSARRAREVALRGALMLEVGEGVMGYRDA